MKRLSKKKKGLNWIKLFLKLQYNANMDIPAQHWIITLPNENLDALIGCQVTSCNP
jgi:hypothetical protein